MVMINGDKSDDNNEKMSIQYLVNFFIFIKLSLSGASIYLNNTNSYTNNALRNFLIIISASFNQLKAHFLVKETQ